MPEIAETRTQPKKKPGRPTSFTQAKAEYICQKLAIGTPLSTICQSEAMPTIATVYTWQATRPAFLEASLRAKQTGTHSIADACIAIADDPDLEPHDKRIRIDTRLRLIGLWNRKEYGERQTIELDVSDKLLDRIKQADTSAKQILAGAAAKVIDI
jgi:hypothetical protein